jgi:AraC family transcriptional regulator, transcriptional activator of pobA
VNNLRPEDESLLQEFRRAIRAGANQDIVDLDAKFTHKFDFQIQRIEHIFGDTKRAVPPNRWSYYRIAFFQEGEASFLTGIYKFKAQKNTLIVMPHRVITSSQNWSLDIKGYIILFNLDFFLQNNFPHKYVEDRKIFNPSVRPYIQLTDAQAEEMTMIFEAIIREKESENKLKEELIALKNIELLIHCERLFEKDQDLGSVQPTVDIIQRFIQLLDKYHLKEHAVTFYADKLMIHPNYLNSLVKRHTGMSTKEIIQNRLLLETKYLLHSTKLSIKEISNKVGFSDPNYFTTFFKRLERVSPATYRTSGV